MFSKYTSGQLFKEHRGLMSMETFETIIHQFQTWEGDKLKVLKLSLYGEPFTNPDFCEMLRIAKCRNRRAH